MLVGQINRGYYALALGSAGRTLSFLGWAITDETAATAWLAGTTGFETSGDTGDCIIVNAWSADTAAVNRLFQVVREAAAPHRLIFFKRHYPDGRIRYGKLAVSDSSGTRSPPGKAP